MVGLISWWFTMAERNKHDLFSSGVHMENSCWADPTQNSQMDSEMCHTISILSQVQGTLEESEIPLPQSNIWRQNAQRNAPPPEISAIAMQLRFAASKAMLQEVIFRIAMLQKAGRNAAAAFRCQLRRACILSASSDPNWAIGECSREHTLPRHVSDPELYGRGRPTRMKRRGPYKSYPCCAMYGIYLPTFW